MEHLINYILYQVMILGSAIVSLWVVKKLAEDKEIHYNHLTKNI